MYGGVGKHGRGGSGGGRGGGKRSLPPPAPSGHLQRVGTSSGGGGGVGGVGGRLSLGSTGPSATRERRSVGAGPGGGMGGAGAPEETFRMISADTLDFAAIIRLTPDLVDEIKRLEVQGGAAKIKFDSNSNNLSGNVIDVGGKEFKFTWSRELGVCDIYEELQNGEDGNGLLSECGSAWRKLNVQRILDESLKNHVKMRSEEAERRLKSRKSIVLDPANPSVKNQAKTLAAAAVEGNMRRMHWKKDQFKKRKMDTITSTVASKPVFKSGTPSHISSGSLPSISPQPSPPEQAGITASLSSFGMANPSRGHAAMDEEHAPLTSNGDNANSERDLSNRAGHGSMRRPVASKGVSGSQPVELRSFLINLLLGSPKGMSLKGLEKAVAETMPNAGKKIESIIKSIATYQAPGRYLLKPGVEVDFSRKPPSENNAQDLEHKAQLTQLTESDIEKIDIEKSSPDLSAIDIKVDDENEEGVCSSSESGSDSDSESDSSDSGSDSGSQSRSKSKSQSPVGSGSASSSDSESGDSSSSKEGSDVDVDIMTSDDDKDETGNKISNISRLSPPGEGKSSYEDHEENASERANQVIQRTSPSDSHDYLTGSKSFAVEDMERRSNNARIKGSPYSQATTTDNVLQPNPRNPRNSGEDMSLTASSRNYNLDKSEHFVGPSPSDKQLFGKDRPDLEQLDSVEKISKGINKRTDPKHFQEKPGSNKRPRGSSSGGQLSSVKIRDDNLPPKSRKISPDRLETNQIKSSRLMASDVDINEDAFDSKRTSDSALAGKCIKENGDRIKLIQDIVDSDSRQLAQMVGNTIGRAKASDGAEKSGKLIERFNGASKHSEKSFGRLDGSDVSSSRSSSIHDKFFMSKDMLNKDIRDVIMDVNEKYSAKHVSDDIGGDKLPSFIDSGLSNLADQSGIQKDSKQLLNSHKADVDKCAASSEKVVPLRRELSELELGEFREPLSVEDIKKRKKPSERKGPSKYSESKLNVMDNFSSDSKKGRTPAKASNELKRESPYLSKCGSQANQDGPGRRVLDSDTTDCTISQQRTTVSSQLQQCSRVDRPESDSASHLDLLSDTAGKNAMKSTQEIRQEGSGARHKRCSSSSLMQLDTKQNGHMTAKTSIDSKPKINNGLIDSSDRSKESFRVESITSTGQKDFSSDEDDSFYAKYDKDEPVLRGPIKDYSQYKEYVQEYREKYDCYSSLNTHLEKYRNEFLKVGRDLDMHKGRDKEAYRNISEQILQMYHRCRKKHSRMKKIFVVLHDELKALKQRIRDFSEEYSRN
ncbi:unnamed protein product [Spirodela intermedia]|uniref:OCEL domain-containing protein n=1 Tax=Spirodela intermedia TaxID=51605 RepID=A0A7I8KDR1_SPIIN|nr:unnamed protein product [Spirodela intermedia]